MHEGQGELSPFLGWIVAASARFIYRERLPLGTWQVFSLLTWSVKTSLGREYCRGYLSERGRGLK